MPMDLETEVVLLASVFYRRRMRDWGRRVDLAQLLQRDCYGEHFNLDDGEALT